MWRFLTGHIFIFMLLIFSRILSVKSSGFFEVLITSMKNTRNVLLDGKCCKTDTDSRCDQQCSTYFQLCFSPTFGCYKRVRSQTFQTSNIDSVNFDQNARLNKIPFTFQWKGSVTLTVKVRDESTDKDILHTVKTDTLGPGLSWKEASYRSKYHELKYKYRIVCSQDYYGPGCIKYCKARDDEHGGHWNCSKNGDRVCLPGWNGTYCKQAICKHPCQNGRCSAPDVCSCLRGWSGKQCTQCLPRSTCVHGKCFRQPGDCNCNQGWGGINCDKEMDYCSVNRPCLNGAQCTNLKPGEYKCICKAGYTGQRCETHVGSCTKGYCKNGGVCKDSQSGPNCICPPHTTGNLCDKELSGVCYPEFCKNNGTCISRSNTTWCQCLHGFTGSQCQLKVKLPSIRSTASSYVMLSNQNRSVTINPTKSLNLPSTVVSYARMDIDISSTVFLGSVSLVQTPALESAGKRTSSLANKVATNIEVLPESEFVTSSKFTFIQRTASIPTMSTQVASASLLPPSTPEVTTFTRDSNSIPLAAAVTVSLSVFIILVLLLTFVWRRVQKHRRPSRISHILPAGFTLPGALLEPATNGQGLKISTPINIVEVHVDNTSNVDHDNKSNLQTCEERVDGPCKSIENVEMNEGVVEKLNVHDDIKNAYLNNGYRSGRSSGYSSQSSSARSSATYRKGDSVQTKSTDPAEGQDNQDLIHQPTYNMKQVNFEGLPNYIMYAEESI